MIFKLLFRSVRREWVRLAVATIGVAAATGLIVWSLGLSMTAARQSRLQAAQFTGGNSLWVTTGEPLFERWRRGDMPAQLPAVEPPELDQSLLDALGAKDGLEGIKTYRVARSTIDFRPDGRVLQGPPMTANITLSSINPYPRAKLQGKWPDPGSAEPEAAVATAIFTPRRLTPPPLGSTLVLVTSNSAERVKITAYIEQPQVPAGFPTLFTAPEIMKRLFGEDITDKGPNLLLSTSEDSAKLAAHIEEVITENVALNGPLAGGKLYRRDALAADLASDALLNFRRQAPLLLTLALLTAITMLYNTLTIGIEQRIQTIALLRTIGMTARQTLQLVACEAAMISTCGWLLGLAGGTIVLWCFTRRAVETFPAGMALGWITPLATALGVALVTLFTLIPVSRRALRIHPLEGRSSYQQSLKRKVHPALAALGIILLFPMMIYVLPLPISAKLRSILILTTGLPLHAVGLFLTLPLFVLTLERVAAPVVARLLLLDHRLLQRRSSRHYRRTAGMVLTIAVGLGSFIAIHIWGGSLMAPFLPSKEFPDVIVSILPNGITKDSAGRAASLPGIADGRVSSIEARQYSLSRELRQRADAIDPKPPMFANALLMGIDPPTLFSGARPMADFVFVEGSRETAAAALATGNECLITRMFSRATGLKKGDTLTLDKSPPPPRFGPPGATPPQGQRGAGREEAAEDLLSFKVAGVIDLNWHLVTSRAYLRGRDNMPVMTMGPVLVDERMLRQVTGNHDKSYFLWANLSEKYRALGALPGSQRLESDIREALGVDQSNTIRVHHRDEIADGTLAHGNHLIGDMARAPFWSLIVLSTGIVTLLVAAVRASLRELRLMRNVGMTRGELGRLLLGEALIATLGGVLLSLFSGACIGWTFTGWTRASMGFAGLPLGLSVPWLVILRGALFAFGLCFAMAIPPVIWLVRWGLQAPQAAPEA